jgi:hypothetical protein
LVIENAAGATRHDTGAVDAVPQLSSKNRPATILIENAAGATRHDTGAVASVPQLSIKNFQSTINNDSTIKDHEIFN